MEIGGKPLPNNDLIDISYACLLSSNKRCGSNNTCVCVCACPCVCSELASQRGTLLESPAIHHQCLSHYPTTDNGMAVLTWLLANISTMLSAAWTLRILHLVTIVKPYYFWKNKSQNAFSKNVMCVYVLMCTWGSYGHGWSGMPLFHLAFQSLL
jgi:hypothetical protein